MAAKWFNSLDSNSSPKACENFKTDTISKNLRFVRVLEVLHQNLPKKTRSYWIKVILKKINISWNPKWESKCDLMNILAPFVRWCSTKTNEIGKHIQGNHGFCSPGCPVELVKGINYTYHNRKIGHYHWIKKYYFIT